VKRPLPLWSATRSGFALFLVALSAAFADLPVPPQVYNPQTPAEAWNVIRLATANAKRLLAENRLQEMTDQVSLCSPALRTLSRFVAGPEHRPVIDEQTVVAYRGINDVAQSSLAGQRQAAELALACLAESLVKLQTAFAPEDVCAEIFTCPQHPEIVTATAGSTCPVCASPLRVRRIPYTDICPTSEVPIARVQASPVANPVELGRKVTFQATLSDAAGLPFPESRIVPLHGEALLFFVADASFTEFHVLTPPSELPGPFELSFVPRMPGSHRLWAGLAPEETALAEYPWTNLNSEFRPSSGITKPDVLSAEVEEYTVTMSFPGRGGSPSLKELSLLRIHVSDAQGQPCTVLEPLDRAFAYLTGIFDDGETMIRLHPSGTDILREDLRGGPLLDFKIYPSRSGYLHLFCQFKVGGRVLTAPLGFRVKE